MFIIDNVLASHNEEHDVLVLCALRYLKQVRLGRLYFILIYFKGLLRDYVGFGAQLEHHFDNLTVAHSHHFNEVVLLILGSVILKWLSDLLQKLYFVVPHDLLKHCLIKE